MTRYILPILITLTAVLASSCTDDIDYAPVGKGNATITASVTFHPLIGSLNDPKSRTEGDAIQTIDNVQICIYTPAGELYRVEGFGNGYDKKFTTGTNQDMPSDLKDAEKSESETVTAEDIKLDPLPFGRYKIFAVANYRDLTEANNPESLMRDSIATPDKLKALKTYWNQADISKNNQMFGYFSADGTSENDDAPVLTINQSAMKISAWVKRLASKLTIVYDGEDLHEGINIYIKSVSIRHIPLECTLGFDKGMLTEQYQIENYVNGNSPTSNDELIMEPENGTLWYETTYQSSVSGEIDEVKTLDENPNISDSDYKKFLNINKSVKALGAVETDENHHYVTDNNGDPVMHQQNMQALYFYENCQGNYINPKDSALYNKTPLKQDVGKNENEDDVYKDRVLYGTYIEVDALYDSRNPATVTNGPRPIKYRFMLGQDVTYNYNALRNRHYKLTLKFRGYANQPEWHIVYDEEDPGLYPQDDYYVSYLYNTRHDMPIRLTGTPYKVTLQIIENNWAPYDATQTDSVAPESATIPGQLEFRWFRDLYLQKISSPGVAENQLEDGYPNPSTYAGFTLAPMGNSCYYGLHTPTLYTQSQSGSSTPLINYTPSVEYLPNEKITPIWVGFLGLQVPSHYDDPASVLPTGVQSDPITDDYRKEATIKGLRAFYTGQGGIDTNGNKGDVKMYECTFDFSNNLPAPNQTINVRSNNGGMENGRNAATLTNNGDDSYTLTAPLFTLPKEIGYISGFSGSNPYEMFERRAKVLISAYYRKDGKNVKIVKRVPVFQTQRIVNPKGVWRTGDSQQPFHVRLMYLQNNTLNSKFRQIESDGEWTAWVATPLQEDTPRSGASIYLSGAKGIGEDGKLHGSSGSFIDFTINFNGTTETTNCEKVIVRYHNNNCQHTILVRQGYNQTVSLVEGGAEWSSFNVFAFRGDLAGRTKPTVSNPSTTAQMPTSGNGQFAVTITGLSAEMTINPLALGTMYKRGNYSEGIRILNNKTYPALQPIGSNGQGSLSLISLKKGTGNVIERVEGATAKWPEIYGIRTTNVANQNWQWSGFKGSAYGMDGSDDINDFDYDLPTYSDFEALLGQELGAGIFYANGIGAGAQETADDPEVAYGYFNDGNNSDMMSSNSGMRGIVIYNNQNYNQIFFPVGYSGIGRRTVQTMPNGNTAYRGYLRYGAVPDVLNFHSNGSGNNTYYNQYRPISYNLPSSPGALYWLKDARRMGTTSSYFAAMDFNYFDLNFSAYTLATQSPDGDALIIKPIVKPKSQSRSKSR